MWNLFFLYTKPSGPYDTTTQDVGLITGRLLPFVPISRLEYPGCLEKARNGAIEYHGMAILVSYYLPWELLSSTSFSDPFTLFFYFLLPGSLTIP